MRCSQIQDEELAGLKLELLYGEADADSRTRVERHLAGCAACREEMAALGRLRRDLQVWTLEGRRPPVTGVTPRRLPAWLAAAAALLLGLGVGLAVTGYLSLRRDLTTQQAHALERDRQHRQEIAVLRAELAERSRPLDAEGVLARFDERVAERVRRSELRQSKQVQATFSDWSGRIEARRRVDLARVAAGLSYLDGRQGQQLARTNELMGYVLEAAAQQR